MTAARIVGAAVGLWLGFIWVAWGFAEMLVVGLVGLAGYGFARFLAGDLDLGPALRRLTSRR